MRFGGLDVAGLVPQLAQARQPFRLAGAGEPGDGAGEDRWRSALDSPWTPWVVGGAVAMVLAVVLAVFIAKLVSRLRSRRPSWGSIAHAMGLDRGECACIERLAAAGGLAEPAAILMTPNVFEAAMAAGRPSLNERDRKDLVALANKRGWPVPDVGGAGARDPKNLPTIETKPLGNAANAGKARGTQPKTGVPRSTLKKTTAPSSGSPTVQPASIGRRPGPSARHGRLSA